MSGVGLRGLLYYISTNICTARTVGVTSSKNQRPTIQLYIRLAYYTYNKITSGRCCLGGRDSALLSLAATSYMDRSELHFLASENRFTQDERHEYPRMDIII